MLHRSVRLVLPTLVLACLWAGASSCASASPRRLPRVVPPDHTGPYTTWWADGIKKEEGLYLDGKRHGEVLGYHPDGSLAYTGTFERGVPTGEVEHYFRGGGGVARTEVVRDGALEGLRTDYYPGGAPRSEAVWVGGRRHGPERQWYDDGSLAVAGHWTEGQATGHWRHWAPTGELVGEEHYWVVDGAPVGRLETVYRPPGVVSVQTLMVQEDGTWSGWVSEWAGNGQQVALVEYRGDLRHGRDVSWNPASGRVLSEGRRVDDQRDGLWTFYDEQGQVERTLLYRAGREVADDEAAGEAGDGPPD